MNRIIRVVALSALALGLAVPGAVAHTGNPNYRSVVNGLRPAVQGLQLSVLGFDSQLQLINRSGRPVVIYGYNGDVYARLLGDGTVEVNRNSPAYYLNEDRFGVTTVPKSASPKAPVRWEVLDKTGRFIWHDHRMHWMAQSLPPQVKDKAKRTKVFDYSIPMQVGTRPVKAMGTLFWQPQSKGAPTGAIIALVVVVLANAVFVVVIRRRRRTAAGAQGASRQSDEAHEAW